MLSEDDVKWDGDLPIVLVMNERDEYVCIEQGEGAEERAVRWVGDHPAEQPVAFSIHDRRCPRCKRTFWHEAPTGSEETGWHCPLCDKLLWRDADGEVYIGAVTSNARVQFAVSTDDELRVLFIQVKEALEGDSNDAEHDALVAVADLLDIPWESE